MITQKSSIIFLFIFISTFSFGQEILKVNNNLGEGITFTTRNKSVESTIYAWGHFDGAVSNGFTNNFDISNNQYVFGVQRMRFGTRGFMYQNKLRYHFQFSVAPAEVKGIDANSNSLFNGLLDGFFEYDLFEGFTVSAGQRFLPGNRNAFTGIRNLQFFDRSALFSFSGYDRDIGVFAWYNFSVGGSVFRPQFALTQGEGRNISRNLGGLNYQARLDWMPFGAFTGFNEIVEGDISRETSPKLAIGVGYGFNDNAGREGGFTGDFVNTQRDIESIYADVLFKYNGISIMAEYFEKFSNIPVVYDTAFNTLATFGNGYGFNFQAGYLFESNWELAGRYSTVFPTPVTKAPNLEKYSLALNKYIAGHGIKIQGEVSYTETKALPANINGVQFILLFALGI